MKLKNLPLSEIKPYWRNPRDNAAAVAAVRQSITDYGFNQPLVLDTENVIIAGHTRYKALLELGAKTAPCVVLDLDPQKAKEYRIVDNKAGELAEWDMGALIPELRELEDLDNLQIYFGDEDLQKLLEDTGGVGTGATLQADVDAAAAAASTQFDRVETNATAAQVDVVCTHCGGVSYVSRDDVIKRLDGNAKD